MPVYILREGISNLFKIGRTSGSVDGVVKRLRTGNPRPLNIFRVIETDQESACETFFHKQLRERMVVLGGGCEFFDFESNPADVEAIVVDTQRKFEERSEIRQIIDVLKDQQSTAVLLEPSKEDQAIMSRLLTIEKEQELLLFEVEMLKGKLMKRIGTASGIRGIATWKTQTSRMYSERLFRDSDPERYQALLEKYYCLDTAAWKNDRLDDYKDVQTTYFEPRISRSFRLQR